MNDLGKHDHDKFNHFVFTIDDTLEKLASLGEQSGLSFDCSLDSLDNFEKFILNNDEKNNDEITINEYAQYIGEVFRKNFGGIWKLGDSHESELDFNSPVIADFNEIGYVFNPLLIVRNFIIRRQKGMLMRAFAAQASDDRLSELKPE